MRKRTIAFVAAAAAAFLLTGCSAGGAAPAAENRQSAISDTKISKDDAAAKLLPLPTAKGSEQMPPIEKLAARKGDAVHGKEVFVSATCVTCHVVNGQGTNFGPELSEIGAKLPKDALYTSILYPSAGISFGYEGWIVSTKDGDDLDGIIASETADRIVLRGAGGINTELKKSDIKDRRQMKLSIMPENLQQQMTTQDLVDLVEYLSTLKKAQSQAAR